MLGFREIEAFRAVVLTGSFSRAADVLNTTQPNVTRLIARLEKSVGFALFVRHARGVVPTSDGAMLYGEVVVSFQGLDDITQYAREIRDHRGAQLTVGTTSTFVADIIPQACAAWEQTHGKLNLTLEQHDASRIIHWVRARRFDVGILSPIYELSGTTEVARREAEYVLLFPADMALPLTEPVDLSALPDLPIILPGKSYFLGKIRDPAAAVRVGQLVAFDAYASVMAAHLARTGQGVAIVDPLTALSFRTSFGCRSLRIFNAPKFEVAVIIQEEKLSSRAARELAEYVVASIDRVWPKPRS